MADCGCLAAPVVQRGHHLRRPAAAVAGGVRRHCPRDSDADQAWRAGRTRLSTLVPDAYGAQQIAFNNRDTARSATVGPVYGRLPSPATGAFGGRALQVAVS